MPRAKVSKKVISVVEENSTETVNGVSKEHQETLAKSKGRGDKKTKGISEKPMKVDDETIDANKKPKKGRNVNKEKHNNDDLLEDQERAEVSKPITKVKGKALSKDSGNKKSQKSENLNVKENDGLTTKSEENTTSVKTRTGRGTKKGKNFQKSEEAEVASSPAKILVAQTKGRKKKEVNLVEENRDDIKTKEAPKRGRAKKQEIALSSDANDENKKKTKIEAEEPVKKMGIKKSEEQNDIVTVEKTKKTSTKKDESEAITEEAAATEKPAGRKRNVAKTEEGEASKPKKSKTLLNPTETLYNKADFELSMPAADENVSNISNNGGDYKKTILKISSWNVAGLRSWLKKDGLKYLEYEEPDIFCLQEIKCKVDQLPEEAARIPGYHPYWLGLSGNYGGVALYSKIMPINVEYGIGDDEFDKEGHIITAEYEKFYLINVYVPNSGQKLVKLDARMRWEKLFQAYVKKLDSRKPLIITGDMNVSHKEIDLSNPKSNTRRAGFTVEEREKMTELLALGFVDTFRYLYPNKTGAYTYWTYFANARARNIGWRLDYFLVSERILKRVIDNVIRSQCLGSDHCPITLFINI